MALVLDAGALFAVDKLDRAVGRKLAAAWIARRPVRTTATVVAQVWRDGARQANLSRTLAGIEVLPLEEDEARRAGELLAATGLSDIVDAHVATVVRPGDDVLTTDARDIGRLVAARGVKARLIGV